jgi:hypothetical protein
MCRGRLELLCGCKKFILVLEWGITVGAVTLSDKHFPPLDMLLSCLLTATLGSLISKLFNHIYCLLHLCRILLEIRT